jgi:hypothetical protein
MVDKGLALHFQLDLITYGCANMKTEIDSAWEKFAAELADKIARVILGIITPVFERYARDGVTLAFTETEAAEILKVSIYSLQKYRKAGRINYYRYNGREVNYSLAHLQDFLARSEHNEVVMLPAKYHVASDISVFGTTETISIKNKI